jgi:hypothetical protein
MAYFVADEKLQGYYVSGGVTVNIVKYHFECDDAASLPAQTAFVSSKNIKISMASTAHVIDTDTVYKMDSSGAWVQQSQPWQPLADYSVLSNKPMINGHTLTGNQTGAALGLQDELTFDSTPTQDSTNPVTSGGIWTDQQRQDVLQNEDRAALVELVDAGAKSLFPIGVSGKIYSNVTIAVDAEGKITLNGTNENTGSGILYQDLVTGKSAYRDTRYTLPVGKYACLASGVTGLEMQVYCHDGNTAQLLFAGSGNRDGVFEYTAALKTSYPYIAFRLAISANTSFTNTVVKPMICTAAAWKISQSFQPYRPSWQEMYDMILALQ